MSTRAPHAAALQATGKFTEFPLPNPNSGPTTVSIAPDGLRWFTESNGNRIGRMAQGGTRIIEFDMTRPLCPYPQVATYKGTGSTSDATNFTCK